MGENYTILFRRSNIIYITLISWTIVPNDLWFLYLERSTASNGHLLFILIIFIVYSNFYDDIDNFVKWWQNTMITAEITKGIESFIVLIELLINGDTICTSAIL